MAEVGSMAGAEDKGCDGWVGHEADASEDMWSGEERHEVAATVVGTEGGS